MRLVSACEHIDRKHEAKGLCRNCYQKSTLTHPGRMRKYNIRKYGISQQEYEVTFQKQKGCCYICGTSKIYRGKYMAIDHNHETGQVRKLLCTKCNTGLGAFQDNVALLHKAISYIEEHKEIKRGGI